MKLSEEEEARIKEELDRASAKNQKNLALWRANTTKRDRNNFARENVANRLLTHGKLSQQVPNGADPYRRVNKRKRPEPRPIRVRGNHRDLSKPVMTYPADPDWKPVDVPGKAPWED